MSVAAGIVKAIRSVGGRLERRGKGLAYKGPPLSDALRRDIQENAAELARLLQPRTPVELVAEACDRGAWLVLRDGEIQVRRHEGAPPLPEDLLERIQANKEAVAVFMGRPAASYTDEEKEALGLSRTFGTDWPGFAWWEPKGTP